MNKKGIVHVLDSNTANKIAAGEVVESPASVVKELVENAIDAGAGHIGVKILDADATSLQVFDNGCGMILEDMQVAVLRHATSKITTASDLLDIATLGFRGEALAAIAAISRLTIVSRVADEQVGYQLTVNGGEMSGGEEAAMQVGTVVTVEDLFYNTPARKKFLKSSLKEIGKISDCIIHLALSRPDISFSLAQEDKQLLFTPGNNELLPTMLAVYGKDTVKKMLQVVNNGEVKISGMISLPELNRSTRAQYNFFVNNRWVRSRELSLAVDEAYHTLLPKGRYPIVTLFLQLPPQSIDVNIHPAKTEIKLREADAVKAALKQAISLALYKKEELAPRLDKDRQLRQASDLQQPVLPLYDKAPWQLAEPGSKSTGIVVDQDRVPFYINAEQDVALLNNNIDQRGTVTAADLQDNTFAFSSLAVIGQMEGTYILARGEDDLYIIDQHAAHERILYERLQAEAANQSAATRALAVPLLIELTAEEVSWLVNAIIKLNNMGFVIEEFGENTFILRNVPNWYEGSDADVLLRDIIEQMVKKELGEADTTDDNKLFMAACKKAVKANSRLTQTDIMAIFAKLDQCKNPFSCPHGRPVAVKISLQEIKRKFLRNSI